MKTTWKKIKANRELLNQYLIREKVVDVIRDYFKSQGFHEAQTPILVPIPSAESNLEVFTTELRTASGKKRQAYLIMSPEYSLKKLISAGIGNVFEITKCFRNEEEVSIQHNPEFTMLEWYRIQADYRKIMNDFETLFNQIVIKVDPNVNLSKWQYQGETYDLSIPWLKISVAEAFERYANIDSQTLLDIDKLLSIALEKGYVVDKNTSWEQLFYQIFFNEIEPELKNSHRPCFVYDYPLSQASLAKVKASDSRFAERFEVFLAGLELGNCFSELIDADEQAKRFSLDLRTRKKHNKTEYPMDDDLIDALRLGMPEVAGIAVGVDRIIQLVADVPTISDTLFFPAQELFDL